MKATYLLEMSFFSLTPMIFDKTHPLEMFNEYQKSVCALKLVSEDEIIMVDQSGAKDSDIFYDLNLGLYQFPDQAPTT